MAKSTVLLLDDTVLGDTLTINQPVLDVFLKKCPTN